MKDPGRKKRSLTSFSVSADMLDQLRYLTPLIESSKISNQYDYSKYTPIKTSFCVSAFVLPTGGFKCRVGMQRLAHGVHEERMQSIELNATSMTRQHF